MKQRIIGALVLVSLAVIFVPMIFDEPHSERQSTPINIPEEPPFPEVERPFDQEPAAAMPSQGSDSDAPTTDGAVSGDNGYRLVEEPEEPAPQPAPEAPAENAQDSTSASTEPAETSSQSTAGDAPADTAQEADFSDSLAGAWVVQLGSFGKEDNARRLRDKVVEMGYGSHLQQVGSGDTRLTRVFSGPFVDKSDAQKAKVRLDKEFGLNSLVTKGDRVAGQ